MVFIYISTGTIENDDVTKEYNKSLVFKTVGQHYKIKISAMLYIHRHITHK